MDKILSRREILLCWEMDKLLSKKQFTFSVENFWTGMENPLSLNSKTGMNKK